MGMSASEEERGFIAAGANLFIAKPFSPYALKNIIEKILADPLTTVAPFTSDKFKKAFSFYKKRADKSWGMVDCFSFITMDEFGIKQALTFDEHFRQAGYAVPIL